MRFAALIFTLLSSLALAQTQPASQPSDRIKSILKSAADRDPGVRSQARHDLLGLTKSDLPALLAEAGSMKPLRSEQWWALRDAVMHISSTPPKLEGRTVGFLGVSKGVAGANTESQLLLGAIVPQRFLGYDAYRALEDGDVIVGIDLTGDLLPISTWQSLAHNAESLDAGVVYPLHVRRNMETLVIPVRVSERKPTVFQDIEDSRPTPFEKDQAAREAKAAKVWASEFEPIVGPPPRSVGQAGVSH